MISAKDLYEVMDYGEEYVIVMMRKDTYHQLQEHYQSIALINVSAKHDYGDDETRNKLVAAKTKTAKSLDKYEFELRQKY